jgi:hypothetical protein
MCLGLRTRRGTRRSLHDSAEALAYRRGTRVRSPFSVSEVVIHEQRGGCLGKGGRDFSDVESASVDGCLVHIRYVR